ncbi:MAG: transposase [Flavobacteriaceae bacterium]|nr:transposase [Flavobacteriaceae bacterium]
MLGIGEGTATLIIIAPNGFKAFYKAKQLSSYFRLEPTERSSRKINKMGAWKIIYAQHTSFYIQQITCVNLYQRSLAKRKA